MHLKTLLLWTNDVRQASAFYRRALGIRAEGSFLLMPDGFRWQLCAPRPECRARGPHGIVPALEVEDIVQAKAWLRKLKRPIVFEEVVPGLARFIFLDPDGNPVELVQALDVGTWERGAHIPDPASEPSAPPPVVGMFEVSLYARDVPAAVRFYREVLGLETGLTYFAHIHLLFDNLPLVIRPTWRQCDQSLPHTPALIVTPSSGAKGSPPWQKHTLCARVWPSLFDGEHTWVLRAG